MRASGQLHAPAVLLPEVHTRIPRTGGLVGTETLWKRETSLAYRESNPGSSRPQLSHYADWATAAQHCSAQCCGRTLQTNLVTYCTPFLQSWIVFNDFHPLNYFRSTWLASDVQQTPTRSKLLPPGYRQLRFLPHPDRGVGATMGQML
jgi:hypothetical protein